MALRILQQSVDGTTGRITARVRVEEQTTLPSGSLHTSHGPEETVMIEPEALLRKFHPDDLLPTGATMQTALEAWLADHHDAALARKQHIDLVTRLVGNLEGTVVSSQAPVNEDAALAASLPELPAEARV